MSNKESTQPTKLEQLATKITSLLISRAIARARMTELVETLDEPIPCPECGASPGNNHAATCVFGYRSVGRKNT